MPYKNKVRGAAAQALRSKKYRAKKHAERFGVGAGNMSGKHGKHASGQKSGRWNSRTLLTSHGYVLVRVSPDHPRAFGPSRLKRFKYAYEHDIVMEASIGRFLNASEVVHHLNGKKDDNRPDNLAIETRSQHAVIHSSFSGARDNKTGRFTKEKRH